MKLLIKLYRSLPNTNQSKIIPSIIPKSSKSFQSPSSKKEMFNFIPLKIKDEDVR